MYMRFSKGLIILFLTCLVKSFFLCDIVVCRSNEDVLLFSFHLFLWISLRRFHLLFVMILISICGCSSKNITPVDVDCSHLVTYLLNKDDVSPITLPPLPPSLTVWLSPLGWAVAGVRKSCLMVFGVWRLSCGCCSLAGWCVTDSRRSLVSSSTYPACLARLTWISWWSITAVLDGSRYSWKTCGERTPLTKVVHPSFKLVSSCT